MNPAAVNTPERDVVGQRVLVGIQMINISRLSTDPVPLVPGTLITVAGQGPVDSNAAGKSSLIASVSLLHADEQWRLSSGAATAAGMLFTARDAGQGDWGNAGHGYIIGVFADPDAGDTAELDDSALTVWIRINRESPHLAVRWQNGVWIPRGTTDAGRAEQADPLWNPMVKRGGRNDIGARGMAEALYGDHVRCVSFLSTSVRATKTPNLLAQPLNEIGPDRIFDAIATLTGLDRELDHERKLRATQHDLEQEARDTRTLIERWEAEAARTEAAIARRERASQKTELATAAWRNRLALRVITATQRQREILDEQHTITKEFNAKATVDAQLADKLSGLTNDEAFTATFRRVEQHHQSLTDRDQDLASQQKIIASTIERLQRDKHTADDRARLADGRDEDTARTELAAARSEHTQALEQHGVAKKDDQEAQKALRAAESGDDLAPHQIAALADEDIHAIPLLDLITLSDTERAVWEPLLAPYRHAVVTNVPLAQAAQALGGIEGSVIIAADETTHASPGQPVTNGAMTVDRFLSVLRARHVSQSDPIRAHDPDAGVTTIGGFRDPLTGRATRIAQARAGAEAAAAALNQAHDRVRSADRNVALAQTRLEAAQAASAATRLAFEITERRNQAAELAQQREDLEPHMEQARDDHEDMKRQRYQRDSVIAGVKRERDTIAEARQRLITARIALTDELRGLDIDRRLTQWQGTEEQAHNHLDSLPLEDRILDETDWWTDAERLVREADDHCFRDAVPESVPTEIRGLRDDSTEGRGKTREANAQAAFPHYLRALRRYLAEMAKVDANNRSQIESERHRRTKDLDAANQALQEQERTTALVRGQLRDAIRRGLQTVHQHFDALDRAYSGHGAGLDFPDPEPPVDPTQRWDWQVAPKWRRSDDHDGMVTYRARANTAQLDDKAVKLVCAAALASSSGRPMVLILDELGRNLGTQHRKDAVALFQNIGADHGITVLGALQDDMERHAIQASGEYIKLRRSSDSRPYNEPPVIVGQDANAPRVEMLRDWLTDQRNISGDDEEDVA